MPLDNAPLSQWHQICCHDGGHGKQSSASSPGHYPANNHNIFAFRESAECCSDEKQRISEEKALPATVDIGHLAEQRLDGRLGYQICGCDP